MPWQSSEAVYWSGNLSVVLETRDVFQRQLYVFRIGVVNDLNTVGYIVQEDLCAGGPSQKGVWKSTGLWWDEPLATLYLHAVCMTALNWEDERSEQYTFDHFWLREEVCGRVWIRLNLSWRVLQVVVISAFVQRKNQKKVYLVATTTKETQTPFLTLEIVFVVFDQRE